MDDYEIYHRSNRRIFHKFIKSNNKQTKIKTMSENKKGLNITGFWAYVFFAATLYGVYHIAIDIVNLITQ